MEEEDTVEVPIVPEDSEETSGGDVSSGPSASDTRGEVSSGLSESAKTEQRFHGGRG